MYYTYASVIFSMKNSRIPLFYVIIIYNIIVGAEDR